MIVQLAQAARPWTRAGPLLVSATGLACVAAGGAQESMARLCGPGLSLAAAGARAELGWRLLDPGAWALGWAAMVAAMMAPLLVLPIEHIARTTLRRRLGRSLAAFVLAYLATWIAPAPLIGGGAVLLGLALPAPATWIAAGALALAWSASPIAQRARNRAHRPRPLAVRGPAADRDCLGFGFTTGLWCVAACWPWMLLCLSFGEKQLVAMPAIALILLAERAMPPTKPRWQLPRFLGFLAAQRPYRALGSP